MIMMIMIIYNLHFGYRNETDYEKEMLKVEKSLELCFTFHKYGSKLSIERISSIFKKNKEPFLTW